MAQSKWAPYYCMRGRSADRASGVSEGMPRFREIYRQHADRYERLIAREDYQGNLWRTVRPMLPAEDLSVVDMGAGTGRFARMFAPVARTTLCLDRSAHMLAFARQKIKESGVTGCSLIVAGNSAIPLRNDHFDLGLAGWSIGHATGWYPDAWREHVHAAVGELLRIIRPGGLAMVFETLGTGVTRPEAPTRALRGFYDYLELERGFSPIQIQTDYRFATTREAMELTRFFFGDELGDRVSKKGWTVVPEWTGLWWKRV